MLIEVLDALLDVLFIFSDYFSKLVHQADASWGFLSGSLHLLACDGWVRSRCFRGSCAHLVRLGMTLLSE